MDSKLFLGTNFEFRDKASEEVSIMWKVIHIISYIPVILSGIITYLTFGTVLANLDGHCILYGNPSLKNYENMSKYHIDLSTSEWSAMSTCEFCECVFCFSIILAITWITFFTLCGRGGSSTNWLPQGWRIVMPAFICNIISSAICFSAALLVHYGYNNFLHSVSQTLKYNVRCHNLNLYIEKVEPKNMTLLYWKLDTHCFCMSRESAWANCGLWLLTTLITLLRIVCCADFTLVRVNIYVQEPIFKGPRLSILEEKDEDVNSSISLIQENDESVNDIGTQTSLTMADFKHLRK